VHVPSCWRERPTGRLPSTGCYRGSWMTRARAAVYAATAGAAADGAATPDGLGQWPIQADHAPLGVSAHHTKPEPRGDPQGPSGAGHEDLVRREGVIPMSRSIYLVNPATDFPSYFGGEVFAARGFRPGTMVADLTLPTLAAMVPEDFQVRLCDEIVSPID